VLGPTTTVIAPGSYRTFYEALDRAGLAHPTSMSEVGVRLIELLVAGVDHELVGSETWYRRILEASEKFGRGSSPGSGGPDVASPLTVRALNNQPSESAQGPWTSPLKIREDETMAEKRRRRDSPFDGPRRSALDILRIWGPAEKTWKTLGSGLRAPIDAETALALIENFDRLVIELTVVQLLLDGRLVARANVDPSRADRWVFYRADVADELHASLPRHDDVAVNELIDERMPPDDEAADS